MFTCGHCNGQHHYADTARACADGRVHPCTWLVEIPGDEDNDFRPLAVECKSSAITDERGSHCEAGHEHVELQVRLGEGWDYVDEEEASYRASNRAAYGYHESRLMDGHNFIG